MLKLKRPACFLAYSHYRCIFFQNYSNQWISKSGITAYSFVNFMPFSFLHNQLVYVTKFSALAEIKISQLSLPEWKIAQIFR